MEKSFIGDTSNQRNIDLVIFKIKNINNFKFKMLEDISISLKQKKTGIIEFSKEQSKLLIKI